MSFPSVKLRYPELRPTYLSTICDCCTRGEPCGLLSLWARSKLGCTLTTQLAVPSLQWRYDYKSYLPEYCYLYSIFSMLRSRSTDLHRCSYENISSRLNRLRNKGPSAEISRPPPSTLNYQLPTTSAHRHALKMDENGIFGLESLGQVGRVSKNTGIRKYNQRVIKEAVTKDANRNYSNFSVNSPHKYSTY